MSSTQAMISIDLCPLSEGKSCMLSLVLCIHFQWNSRETFTYLIILISIDWGKKVRFVPNQNLLIQKSSFFTFPLFNLLSNRLSIQLKLLFFSFSIDPPSSLTRFHDKTLQVFKVGLSYMFKVSRGICALLSIHQGLSNKKIWLG